MNLLTQDDETETSLRGELGTAKRAGWTDEIDHATVKAIGREQDATVNDSCSGRWRGRSGDCWPTGASRSTAGSCG